MNLNVNELTLDNMGLWPMSIKIIFGLLLFCAILFSGYWFDGKAQLAQLSTLRAQQETLLKTINGKQQQAVNLAAYRNQLKELNSIFNELLQHLPKPSEIPGLLENISKAGLANGLSFKLIKPEQEIKTDFYSELPVHIAVMGDYHHLAKFISAVAELDYIVTLHDFTLRPVTREDLDNDIQKVLAGDLILTITAKTWRYLGSPDSFAVQRNVQYKNRR
jgi:type IV pilus assembly protein PilO